MGLRIKWWFRRMRDLAWQWLGNRASRLRILLLGVVLIELCVFGVQVVALWLTR
ncbi:MAG: hypothetical protein PHC78_10015 [Verrucomicrobiota bacterium]|nr:hypothetical protein [Verrucomicrobiota bacterium]